MFTPFLQMIICFTVKPKWHKCGLHPQLYILVGEYPNNICNTSDSLFIKLFLQMYGKWKVSNPGLRDYWSQCQKSNGTQEHKIKVWILVAIKVQNNQTSLLRV